MFLKDIRIEKHMTAKEVYNELRIDKNTFSKLESGKTELRVDWIPVLSKKYGKTNEEIMHKYLNERREIINDKCRNKAN